MASIAVRDPGAPAVAATPPNYQGYITARAGVQSPFLCVNIHGSDGKAEDAFETGPDNNPNFYTSVSTAQRDFFAGLVARGIVVWSHDFYCVDPVTNLYEPNSFGAAPVMATIDRGRTEIAPQHGLRSDMIGLCGASQGSGDTMQYLLQWPERVAYCVWILPGAGDSEGTRYGNAQTPGRYQVPINRCWLGAGHDYDAASFALGVGGPALVLRGATLSSYAVNDMVSDPARVTHAYGSYLWRCVAPTSTFDPTSAAWTPLDPLAMHFRVPSEGGTSLAWPASSPLAGLPESTLEPANITRMRQIVDGTLPVLNGRRVPVFCYYSTGDGVTMGQLVTGVPNGGPWWFGQIGVVPVLISTEVNHGGQGANPQPLDPKWAAPPKSLTSNASGSANSWASAKTGGNNRVIIHVDEATFVAGTTFAFETSLDNGGTWQAINANSTVQYRASTLTEGPPSQTANAAGWYRVTTTTSGQLVRIRKTAGSNVTVTLGPTYAGDAEMQALVSGGWVDDVARKILRVR